MYKLYSFLTLQRIPSVMCRLTSSTPTVGGGDSKKPVTPPSPLPAQKQESTDKSTYKVKEYYSYNEYSFYDLENVIDSSGRRQIQPDPKQNYHHTDPWAKKEKSSA